MALKIGMFGSNCSSSRTATKVPERWIQLGAFANAQAAINLQKKLQKSLNTPHPITVTRSGLVIGLVESFSGFYLPDGFKDTAPYIVVLAMLWFMPNGLFGEKLRKKV